MFVVSSKPVVKFGSRYRDVGFMRHWNIRRDAVDLGMLLEQALDPKLSWLRK